MRRKNVSEFVAQSDIDGVLIGGASLSVEEFSGMDLEPEPISFPSK